MKEKLLEVAYDREIFQLQSVGGVSKYFAKIISIFDSESTLGIHPNLTFKFGNNLHLMATSLASQTLEENDRFFFQPTNGLETLLTLGPVRTLNSIWAGGGVPRLRADIFHATYYRPTYFERTHGKKLVATVHDFIPEKLGWTGVRNPHIGKHQLCKRADLIVCVSKQTAIELQERYKIDEGRIAIVPHGCEPVDTLDLSKSAPETLKVLYVGHRGGYKNFDLLVDALEILRTQKIDFQLMIAGPEITQQEGGTLNKKLDRKNWNFEFKPSDARLTELYDNATVHCVTSRFEGFGMTILESMARGTPVIATDIPVFREVGGESARYFVDGHPESLADELLRYIDIDLLQEESRRALNHAKLHTWHSSSRLLADSYRKIGLN